MSDNFYAFFFFYSLRCDNTSKQFVPVVGKTRLPKELFTYGSITTPSTLIPIPIYLVINSVCAPVSCLYELCIRYYPRHHHSPSPSPPRDSYNPLLPVRQIQTSAERFTQKNMVALELRIKSRTQLVGKEQSCSF